MESGSKYDWTGLERTETEVMGKLSTDVELIAREARPAKRQERAQLGAQALGGAKFSDPQFTLLGEPRATVAMDALTTVWFNTGTLCNLTCANCYIESSPSNDRLAYLQRAEVAAYLEEMDEQQLSVREIGFTGGEPFMNPEFVLMLRDVLHRGYRVVVLTNAMRPMMKCSEELLRLQSEYADLLTMRVSVDHYDQRLHEEERGRRSFAPMVSGLQWLSRHGFTIHVAGRTRWGGDEAQLRAGFAEFFAVHDIEVDADDPVQLVLFPEMDPLAEVAEITTACWGILDVDPNDMMCASARMVVKRKGATAPSVVACTLLPYEQEFELSHSLTDSLHPISLNHAHCAKFCVLGGGSCSASN